MDLYEAPLGHPFTPDELKQAVAIFGAVGWPGRRPGYAVVLAVCGDTKRHLYDLIVLDEAQSSNLREMIHHCESLDTRYQPSFWAGDDENTAAEEIILDLCDARPKVKQDTRPGFTGPYRSDLLELDHIYAYAMPLIQSLLQKDHKRLYLKGSIWPYIEQPQPDDLAFLEHGEYPAIEAMAFAVREALDWIQAAKTKVRRNPVTEQLANHPMAF